MELSDLYRALEIAHYGERLRDTVTLLGLSRNTSFQDMILDFKVLAAHRARLIVVAPDPAFELSRTVALMNTHGGRFRTVETQEPRDSRSDALRVDIKQVQVAIEDGEVPVVLHHGLTRRGADLSEVERLCREIAFSLGAQRAVGMANVESLEPVLTRTRITLEELIEIEGRLDELGIAEWAPRVRNVRLSLEGGVSEFIYVAARPGRLCQELLTHEGAGILFCRHDETVVRRAELRDVNDIMLQLRPDIEAGVIRGVTENSIAEHVNDFWVCEVDGRIVATMRVKRYDTWVELATGSTLLRDRKRGRARQLLSQAIAEVEREPDVTALFAVSLNERLLQSLSTFGFAPIDKSELPESWRRNYDPERPSLAYAKRLRD